MSDGRGAGSHWGQCAWRDIESPLGTQQVLMCFPGYEFFKVSVYRKLDVCVQSRPVRIRVRGSDDVCPPSSRGGLCWLWFCSGVISCMALNVRECNSLMGIALNSSVHSATYSFIPEVFCYFNTFLPMPRRNIDWFLKMILFPSIISHRSPPLCGPCTPQ